MRSILMLLAVNLVCIDCATPIGTIYNAAYVSSDVTSVVTYITSCSECICYAFFSTIPSSYVGLNCYKSNQTCLLFANYTSPSTVTISFDSTFVFIAEPPVPTTEAIYTTERTIIARGYIPAITSTVPATTEAPSQTTASSCISLQWNSTGITFATNGTGSNQVAKPYAVFIVAGSDVLYIADTNNHRVQMWLPGASGAITVAGGQGSGLNATQLNSPKALYIDQNENLFVADTSNYRVQYFENGSFLGRTIVQNGTTSSPNNRIGNIFGIGVDFANNVYISEYNFHRLLKLQPNATNATFAAGNGSSGNSPGQLNTPTGFYVDPTTGTLYIANQGAHCIVKWFPGASNGSAVAGRCGTSGTNASLLNTPKSVTFDKYGNMYVVDASNLGRVIMFCPDSLIGIPIITSGLNSPQSIAVDTNLSLYVSDWNNNRLVKYTLI